MCHLLSNSLKNCLSISLKSIRFLSGIKSEIDLEVKRIRKWKRIFAFSLFGITLTTTILIKNNKRKEWIQLLQQMRRLQGQKFGDFELFEFHDIILAEPIIKIWNNIEKFKFRNEDTVIVSFPKTGITWLQEIVWLLSNDLDFKRAKLCSITERFPYLENPSPGITSIERMKSPRFIKTHLTPSLLFSKHNNKEERPKVLAILRNPKDVLISYYHFSRMNQMIGYKGNFDDFFDRFVKGLIPYGPIWKHYNDVIDWNQNDSELSFDENKILIVFYEDLKRDFANQVNRICEFLGKQKLNEEDMKLLKTHCSFKEMKVNPSVNYKYWDDLGFRDKNESEFMRRGEIGDWKNYLNSDQNDILNKLIDDKFGNKFNFTYE